MAAGPQILRLREGCLAQNAGWVHLEVALDYSSIRTVKIAEGSTIGFHVGLDDTDAADREVQITWTGREAHDQSLGFGNMTFSSEPAIAKELARGPKSGKRGG